MIEYEEIRPRARGEEEEEPDLEEEFDAEPISGAAILRDARSFVTRFLYMTDEMHDALVLFCAASHALEAFTTVPRALAVAPDEQSGKTTLLSAIVMLGCNPWKADPTSYALRSKFNAREKPLVVIDEISEYYGASGLRAGPKDLNKILLEGYACDGMLSLSVDRMAVDVSCFCFAAMGGLKAAVRSDIWDRSVVWRMKPVPVTVQVEDALADDIRAIGKIHSERIHQWAREHQDEIRDAFRNFRRPHRKMVSRLRQIWGPLYAVAVVAGEDWAERCIAAFKTMALDASDQPVLSDTQMILRDSAGLFAKTGASRLFAADIRKHLRSIPDITLYQDLSDRGLARLMTQALGPAQSMDIGTSRAKGYHDTPVLNAWKRLEAQIEPPDEEDAGEDEFGGFFDVEEVA